MKEEPASGCQEVKIIPRTFNKWTKLLENTGKMKMIMEKGRKR